MTGAPSSRRPTPRRSWRLVRDSVRLVRQADGPLFWLTSAGRLAGAGVLALQVVAVKLVLDAVLDVSDGADGTVVVLPIVLLAGASALTALLSAVMTNQLRLLAELVTRGTWRRLLDVSTRVDLIQFDHPAFYDRLQRVQLSAMSRTFSLTQGLLSVLGGAAGSLGLTVVVLTIEPLLLPLLLVAALPLLFTSRAESRLEFEFMVRQTPRLKMRQYLALLQTSRDEAKEIRAFGAARRFRERFDATYEEYLTDLRHHVRRRSALALVGNLGSAALLAASMFLVVWFVTQDRIGLADAGAALVAVRMLSGQVNAAVKGVQQVSESGLFLEDLHAFLRMAPPEEGGDLPAPAGFGLLRAQDVHFTYPGAQRPALRGVDVEVRAGEVVALVGENGSGKTTLSKLLGGLYRPDQGTVRWDDVDLADVGLAEVRRRISVTFQDFVRYQLSAEDNVTVARPDDPVNRERVRAALERAGIAALVDGLPDGAMTPLSKQFEGGQELSGGQWQRVALARAFYRDAPFVILDEPSAALDARAEHELFASLRELLAGRSVLFISHRFSTVRSADRIYVMHEGEVVEHGTHDELMRLGGRYAELFRLQASQYLTESSTVEDAVSPARS